MIETAQAAAEYMAMLRIQYAARAKSPWMFS